MNSNITYNYADYQDDGSYNISQRVSSVTDTANPANNRYYMYGAYGNVTAIYKNESYSTVEVRYNYDSASRLIKEYVSSNDYTDYTYDGSGNITQSYKYTNNTFAWTSDKDVYTYDTNGRLVQLTNTYTMTRHNSGGEITPVLPTGSRAVSDQYVQTSYYFAYDALGNPVKYRVSSLEAANNLVWMGRKLTSGNLNNNVFAYTYDAYGMRVSKTVNGLKTNYYVSGSTIIAEERLNANGGVETFIYYIYDTSGIAGLFVNNAYYYFTKNLFGDIIGIKNAENELVASYTYNAWGECTIKMNVDGIATLNPFRYRGYYFDTETGFYYLQTRYYDPDICRFISADDPEILGDLASVVGQLNLYAYCLNNPVMFTDETGNAVITTVMWIAFAVVTFVGAFSGVQNAYENDTSTLSLVSGGIAGGVSAGIEFCLEGLGFGPIAAAIGSIINDMMYQYMVYGYNFTSEFYEQCQKNAINAFLFSFATMGIVEFLPNSTVKQTINELDKYGIDVFSLSREPKFEFEFRKSNSKLQKTSSIVIFKDINYLYRINSVTELYIVR